MQFHQFLHVFIVFHVEFSSQCNTRNVINTIFLTFDVLTTGFELPHCGLRGELPLDGDLGVVLVCRLVALGCSMMSFKKFIYVPLCIEL